MLFLSVSLLGHFTFGQRFLATVLLGQILLVLIYYLPKRNLGKRCLDQMFFQFLIIVPEIRKKHFGPKVIERSLAKIYLNQQYSEPNVKQPYFSHLYVLSTYISLLCTQNSVQCVQRASHSSKVLSLCQEKNLDLLFPLWAKSFGQFSSLAHYPLSLGFNPKNHFGVGLTIHYTVLDLFKSILLFFQINHSLLNFLPRVCLTFSTKIFSRNIR